MTSNRLINDKCSFEEQVQQSTDPFKYITDKINYEHNDRCGKHLVFGNRADIESELRGQTRCATECAKKKYNPKDEKSNVSDKSYAPPDVCNISFGHMPVNNWKK